MKAKAKPKHASKRATPGRKRATVGERIIEGLQEAVAWTKGEKVRVRVTLVHMPEVDIREIRKKMGLSQAQFATKFGFPRPRRGIGNRAGLARTRPHAFCRPLSRSTPRR